MKFNDIMTAGGPVMWPLLACSIIVLTVVIERALFWYSLERKRTRKIMDDMVSVTVCQFFDSVPGA